MQDITVRDREGVYPVSEDTHLLAESVEVHPGETVLEIGCGTGYVSLFLAAQGAVVTGVDINPLAVALARENARESGLEATFIESDLFAGVDGTYDVIVCNPPYLPSEDIEKTPYDACWDGGPTGREFSARFIAAMPSYLSPRGRAYLLQSSLCSPDASVGELVAAGFSVTVAGTRALFFERLFVFCARRSG
ncbi:MAG: methyltransferase [Candidatus Methanofastidiosa archaeon]|jgi:release factor glutamine methyltransferase|nr:methyltransferase [Candidatus Methanofastidiosa archaeon]